MKRLIVIIVTLIVSVGTPDLVRHVNAQKEKTLTANTSPAIAVVEEFWVLAQKGRIKAAQRLRTDTSNGFKITIKDSTESWEKTIHETKMEYLNTLGEKCVTSRECTVASRIRNRRGQEIRLYHTVVKNRDAPWRIRFISY